MPASDGQSPAHDRSSWRTANPTDDSAPRWQCGGLLCPHTHPGVRPDGRAAGAAGPRSACWRRKRRHRPARRPISAAVPRSRTCLRRGAQASGIGGEPSRPPTTQAKPSRPAPGVKVVRPVGRSTLTPGGRPAPLCVGRRRTGWLGRRGLLLRASHQDRIHTQGDAQRLDVVIDELLHVEMRVCRLEEAR